MTEIKETEGSSPRIQTMESSHVDEVVEIHLQAFPDFFLSFLGVNFLKAYYLAIIRHESTIKLVVHDSMTVKGFVVGPMNPCGFYSSLLKTDWLSFALSSIPSLIRRPQILPRIFRAFLKPAQSNYGTNVAELSSLAVKPQKQGKNYGQLLVNEFIGQCKNRSGKGIILTTDAFGNDKVNNFYRKAGFILIGSYSTPENRVMNQYKFIIS